MGLKKFLVGFLTKNGGGKKRTLQKKDQYVGLMFYYLGV